ncbi:MAG: glycosyltransferase family 4 protein [Phycisphaerae bacterium]
MRILIINQAFWPDVVATSQLMTDWAEHLTTHGHEVQVIASRSVYGQQGGALPRRETYQGTKIHRVGLNLFRKGGILTRLIDFGLFHILAFFTALFLPRPDVVVCLTTPPFIGIVGRAMQMLRGSRYVQYEMDLYPDVPVALGVMKPQSFLTRRFEGLHRYLFRKADRIIVLGRCMQRVIAAKNIAPEKMVLVTPWSDPDQIVPPPREHNAFRKEYRLQDKLVVMYSGNLGLGHDISTLCAAMERLYKDCDPRDREIQFVFIGGGKRMREVTAYAKAHGLPEPLMLGYQPREKLSETLSAGDVHLITQAPGTTGLIVPSKYYGILAAGRPSLYIGPLDTEVALSIREQELGTVLEIGQVEECVAFLRKWRDTPQLRAEMETRARKFLRENHSRQVCTERLTEVVTALLAPPNQSGRNARDT